MHKISKGYKILRKEGISELALRATEYVTRPIQEPVFKSIINVVYPDGVDMAKEDWDHLLILDACRADMFEEVIGRVGDQYTRIHSNASATPEWIENTFSDKRLGDTVYVTANPWVSREAPHSFHEIINLWVEETELEHSDIENIDGNLDDLDLDSVPHKASSPNCF